VNADTTIATNLPTGGGNTTITNAQLTMAPGSSIYYATDWTLESPSIVTVGVGGTLTLPGWGYGAPGLCFLRPGSEHLVIDGGTVEQKFAGDSWGSRGFTIGANGATLKNSMTSGISYMQDGWGIQITNNTSLTLSGDGAGKVDIDQIISGTGSLTKNGTGTWILSRANTYTGATTINQGTLSVTQPTFAPDALLTIASGAVLNLPNAGFTYLKELSINGALVTDRAVYNSTNSGGAITGSGQIKRGGILTWNATTDSNWDNATANWTGNFTTWSSYDNAIFGSAATPGTVTVGTGVAVNDLTISTAGYTIAGGTLPGDKPLVVAGTLTVSADATIATNIPTGGGNTTITNGTLALTNGASLYYTTDWTQESPAVVTVGTGGTLQLNGWGWGSPGLSFLQPGTNQLVIDGGTVELKFDFAQWNSRGLTVGTNGATLKNSLFGSGWAVMDNGWGLEIANNASSGLTLSGDGTGSVRINQNITGTGPLVKTGSSRWDLSGTNTYTGPTTVNGGLLGVSAATGMGPSTVLTMGTATGTAVAFQGTSTNYTVASLAGGAITSLDDGYGHPVSSGNINFSNSGNSLTLTDNANHTFGGSFNGNGNVIKTGSGTLTLTGWNNLQGRYVISNGVVDGTGGSLFNWWWASDGTNAGVNVNTGGKLLLNNWNSSGLGLGQLYTDRIDRIVIDGGTVEINQATSGYRPFTIGSNGATILYTGGDTGSSLDNGAIPLTNNSNLTLGGTGICSMKMNMTGTGALTKSGAGEWIMTGTNSYSGATTVSAGTLSITAPNLSDTATLSIASGAMLNLPYTGTDHVGALVIHGATQPDGVYDSTNSSGAITGTGKILVGSAGSPAYLAWATSFTGFTDTYPTHDPDGDGMTNQQEFAFGLDPTKGSSSDPIVVPLNKAAGTFSYTREDPAVGGLTYKVYTSTNLSTWTLDTGATENVTGQYYDVQTVEVTLGGLPLTASKLFVRVAAE
jgi:autotransporter-associated beta strand protein